MQEEEFIYRFRSLDKIFKFNELQNKEIFFSSSENLNDPLEGFRDIYWEGGKSSWKYLLKDYFLCYKIVYALATVDNVEIKNSSVYVALKFQKQLEKIGLNTAKKNIKEQYIKKWGKDIGHKATEKFFKFLSKDKENIALKDFFSFSAVDFLLESLPKKGEISKNELSIYLAVIRLYYCYPLMLKHYGDLERESCTGRYEIFLKKDRKNKELFEKIPDDERKVQDLLHEISEETPLLYTYRDMEFDPNNRFILYDFAKRYIKILEERAYWPFYTACFTKTFHNTSMWGYYADGHRGICLKFKPNIKASGEKGLWLGKPVENEDWIEFYDVKYVSKFNSVNFFGGNNFENLFSYEYTKTKKWEHEEEIRLIIKSFPRHNLEEKNPHVQYRFPQLDGIIFGMRTSEEHKVKIIKIVRDICKDPWSGRDSFNFYQAYYKKETDQIECKKLNTFSSFSSLDNTIAKLPK